ncbi:MAG: polysaccharide biosynthesis tyrosine autokinase [Hyphomicrobiaceae bacterium]|nr:polysaccharide biosynthesis tyrosine autokinase [Hyphomicrobiaceae bacterium]
MRSSEDSTIDTSEVGGFGPRDIIAALRRRWWLIAILGVIGGLIAALVALSIPNRYEAIATIQIDPRKKTIVQLDAVLPDIAGDTPTIESQVEILHSRAIALQVIEALDLRNDPEFNPPSFLQNLRQRLPFLGLAPAPTNAAVRAEAVRSIETDRAARGVAGPPGNIGSAMPERDEMATAFAERLKTYRVRNSLIVELRYSARDPVKAARIANAIAEVYIRDQIEMKIRATGFASDLLEGKLGGLRKKVAEAEHRVARFKADNNIFDTGSELLSERQLSRLMEQTIVARNTTVEARARFDQLQEMLRRGEGKNVGEVLQSHTVRMLKEQLGKATRREAELITKYGPRHPELIKARAELADVNEQLGREIDQIVANVKNEYKVAADRERQLDQSLNELKDQQSVSKEVSIKLRELERDAETSRRVLDAFLARYKQTTETQDLHLPDARVVEKADIPNEPAAPKRKQIVMIGAFGGAGLGLAITFLLAFLATGLSRPEDVDTAIGVPHLASVPLLQRQSDGLSDPMLALRLVLAQPKGAFAQALDTLVQQLGQRGTASSPQVLLVGSSLPNEGKSVIAANLALLLASRGTRTLLIDADLRRSVLTQNLGIEHAPGLLDAISHGQDFEKVLLQDTASGLAVMPAGSGRVALSPVDVLEAPGFGQRLARLKAHFDMIIIDTPPLLPVVDGRILADYADQILLVAAWQRTPRELLRKAVALLGANSAKIAGLVINQVGPGATQASSYGKAGGRTAHPRRRAAA